MAIDLKKLRKQIDKYKNLESNEELLLAELRTNPSNTEAKKLLTECQINQEVSNRRFGKDAEHLQRGKQKAGITAGYGAIMAIAKTSIVSASAILSPPVAIAILAAGGGIGAKGITNLLSVQHRLDKDKKELLEKYQVIKESTIGEQISFLKYLRSDKEEIAKRLLRDDIANPYRKNNGHIYHENQEIPLSQAEQQTGKKIQLTLRNTIMSEMYIAAQKVPDGQRKARLTKMFRRETSKQVIMEQVSADLKAGNITEQEVTHAIQALTRLPPQELEKITKQRIVSREHPQARIDYKNTNFIDNPRILNRNPYIPATT